MFFLKLDKYRRLLVVAVMFQIVAVVLTPAVQAFDDKTRVELQMTLKSFIDGKTAEGTYKYFDAEMGMVRNLALLTLHPVIFEKQGYYLMCADFIDKDMTVDVDADVDWADQKVLLDYIVVPIEGRFIVEQEIIGKRGVLTKIFRKLQLGS